MNIEKRAFIAEGLKVERREGETARIVGHAAVFNSLSEPLGGFRERVLPGAFAESIGGDDIRALFNHDSNYVLGRNRAKTLSLKEDTVGLAISIMAPDTPTIRDLVLGPIERGDVTQMSFAFSVLPDGQDWSEDEDKQIIRTLKRVRLYEVSPVVFPAYPATDVAVRELRAWQASLAPKTPFNLLRAKQQQARA